MTLPNKCMAIFVVLQLLEVYVNPTQRYPLRTFYSHRTSDINRLSYTYVQRAPFLGDIRRHSGAASILSARVLH